MKRFIHMNMHLLRIDICSIDINLLFNDYRITSMEILIHVHIRLTKIITSTE